MILRFGMTTFALAGLFATTEARAEPPAAEPPTPPPPAAEEPATLRISATRRPDMQDFAEGARQEIHIGGARARYALNLFGDAGLGVSSRRLDTPRADAPARAEPFVELGVADVLFTADLERSLLATVELTFTQATGESHSPLERLQLGYRGKHGFIEAGRFHTDLGYWNVAYHHGRWLQLPIERPRTIALHGGLIPAHWAGLQGGIILPMGQASLHVSGSIGSARDEAPHGAHREQSVTRFLAGHARVEARDLFVKDLRVGVSGVHSYIPGAPAYERPGLPDVPIKEWIAGAHVAYPSLPLTLISEGYWIRHTASDYVWNTFGAFALAGYTIGNVTPYVMVEHVRSPGAGEARDPFFVPDPASPHPPGAVLRMTQGTLGVRVDVTTWAAVKAEYRAIDRPDLGTFAHAAVLNGSFGL